MPEYLASPTKQDKEGRSFAYNHSSKCLSPINIFTHLCTHTSTAQQRVSTAAHSVTLSSLMSNPGSNTGKNAEPFLQLFSSQEFKKKARNRSVNRVPDSRATTATPHKDNSEFRPNKQLSKVGVPYCNSKAHFYKDHYLAGNSV